MSTATMAVPQDQDAPPDLGRQLRTAERRRRLRSMALTLPLLAFLLVVFMVPLAGLLIRAVENPEVADTLGHTGAALQSWDRQSAPPDAVHGVGPGPTVLAPGQTLRRTMSWHLSPAAPTTDG